MYNHITDFRLLGQDFLRMHENLNQTSAFQFKMFICMREYFWASSLKICCKSSFTDSNGWDSLVNVCGVSGVALGHIAVAKVLAGGQGQEVATLRVVLHSADGNVQQTLHVTYTS